VLKADEPSPSDFLTRRCFAGAQRLFLPRPRGQSSYVDAILDQVLTFGIGLLGTGKSYLSGGAGRAALQAIVNADRADGPGVRRVAARVLTYPGD